MLAVRLVVKNNAVTIRVMATVVFPHTPVVAVLAAYSKLFICDEWRSSGLSLGAFTFRMLQ